MILDCLNDSEWFFPKAVLSFSLRSGARNLEINSLKTIHQSEANLLGGGGSPLSWDLASIFSLKQSENNFDFWSLLLVQAEEAAVRFSTRCSSTEFRAFTMVFTLGRGPLAWEGFLFPFPFFQRSGPFSLSSSWDFIFFFLFFSFSPCGRWQEKSCCGTVGDTDRSGVWLDIWGLQRASNRACWASYWGELSVSILLLFSSISLF